VRARDEAVAGERAKAELVAVMSHEMRTPLNGIVGALEVLTTTKLDKTQTHMTDVMETSANMLLQHVNDVLDMSRLEAGAAEQIKRPFDPVDVTRELLRSLKMSAHNHGNTLELKALDPHFKLVLGDPAKLRQILTNLVGNAIKFTRNGTITVEIEPHPAQGLWELRVSDQGIGIAEEDFAKIFDDFVTLDPSYTRAQEGTGLGLAIVRRLVEHLGGEIGVESVLGEGSVFWVKLPTNMLSHGPDATDVATLPAGGLGDEAPSEHLSILLVEDNEINRVVAREMLEKLGHRVVEAHNGIEGVEIANLQKFDVILMDISMPEMDGLQATQLIKSGGGLNSDTPIHAVTAHAMPTDIERFGAAGMADVLIKPIGLDRLAGLLAAKPPSAPGGNSGDLLWDRAVFDEMATAMGPDKLSTVLAQFTTEMNAACQGVFSVTHVDDPAALKSEVHRLAGSAAIVGARALRETLHRAEAHLDAANGADALRELASVEECWGNTQAAMPTPHG